MANAYGIRPNPELSKLLYKALRTPKTLREDTKNFDLVKVMFWTKSSFPYQSGTQ